MKSKSAIPVALCQHKMTNNQAYELLFQTPGQDSEYASATRSNNNWKMFMKQVFAAAVACLGGFSMGAVSGYTSPVMKGIQQQFNLDGQQVSLVTSLGIATALPGGFTGGALSDYFGRRLALIFVSVIYSIGWLLLLWAPNLAAIYTGRAVTGLAKGMASTCAPVYVAEIASPEIRGKLGSYFQFFVALGVLYTYVMGAILSWNQLALACLGISVVQAVLLLIVPESPLWLRRHGLQQDALAVLKWLHRSDIAMVTSADRLTLRSFTDPKLLKPLGIVFVQMFVQECSGITVVVVYAASILQESDASLDANVSSIFVAVGMVVAVLVAYVIVDRFGRRILLIISGVFMSIGLISLGSYYYARDIDPTSTKYISWLPIASLVTYVFAFGIGFGPMPWIMMGELFPTKARGIACGIITTLKWTMAFALAQTFLDMKAALHDYGVFWLFGAVSVCGIVFTCFFVPETKGKTLDEVESHFKGKNEKPLGNLNYGTNGVTIVGNGQNPIS